MRVTPASGVPSCMAGARGEPGRAPDPIRIGDDLRDPLLRAAPTLCGALRRTLPDLAPDKREGDLGLFSGQDHLERLDSERAALSVRVIRDPNRFTDPIAVPQRENGDHEPARKLDLIVERSPQASRRSVRRRLAPHARAPRAPPRHGTHRRGSPAGRRRRRPPRPVPRGRRERHPDRGRGAPAR